MSKTPKRGRPKKSDTNNSIIVNKYSKSLIDFIADKIEEGRTLRQVCEEFKDIVPTEKTIYSWRKKHEYARDMIKEAYQTYFFKLIDETKFLADEPIDDDLSSQEKNVILKQRDQKIKTNQFLLIKIAPMFIKEMEKKQDPMVNLQLPPIQVISYKDVTPKEE